MALVSVGDGIAIAALIGSGAAFIVRWLDRRQDARRLEAESRDAEARQRADTAIRAVTLLDPSERQAGALFALASLGQLDFAIELLRELWPRRAVSTPSALWVIDRAFTSGNREQQVQAAGVLVSNARLLAPGGSLLFPHDISVRWPSGIARGARLELLRAYVEAAALVPSRDRRRAWAHLALVAHAAMTQDEDRLVRRDAGLWLETLLGALDLGNDVTFTNAEGIAHRVQGLMEEAAAVRDAGGPSPTQEVWDAMAPYRDLRIALRWAFAGVTED